MTTLTTYDDTAPFAARETITALADIAAVLAAVGVGLERWPTQPGLSEAPDDAAILSAHAEDIAKLQVRGGYRSSDVVRLTPDNPKAGEMRAKFLAEHVHDDDEVRFFVEGSGMFYIRAGGRVHALECTAGDLIVLPAGLRHWFDTGAQPRFTAIRLFTTPEGWVARFTGEEIAARIPLYEGAAWTTAPGAIVTDIEGTTSSLAFVHEVLFPYSRARLAGYVAAHPDRVAPILAAVRAEAGQPYLDEAGCVALLGEWHDADRKIAPLKDLQGLIWADGYAEGELHGHVYDDAVAGLRRWHDAGVPLYVYSSGSVAAQRLLFGHTAHGDLSVLFSGHFDTAIGGKREAASYRAIAGAIGHPAQDIMFLSDVPAELEAARAAGFDVVLVDRDGAASGSVFPVVASFDAIAPS